ncbi:MAG: tetratricopeptide repeat protein [Flavobacteriales bacterium]|jgi:tetratricopeptide (TPR) repeat protein
MFINKEHESAYKLMQELHYEKAVKLYSKVITQHPNAPELYSERGVAYIHLQQQEKSMADLNKSVELQPDYAYRYASRGHAKDFFGDIDGAIEDYEIAAEMDPNDPIVYNNLGLLLEKKGNMISAKEKFRRSDALREQEKNLQNVVSEIEGKTIEIPEIQANSNERKIVGQEKESTAEEMKKIFTKKSQWKEFLKFVTNGFKIK